MSKQENKSPITCYYGGKFGLSKIILGMIPKHDLYVEPFFGGGSIFFLKKRSKKETINDINSYIYTFWKVVKENGYELQKRLDKFLYLEEEYVRASKVLKGVLEPKDEIDKAYCVFVSVNMAYRGRIGSTLSIATKPSSSLKVTGIHNKISLIETAFLKLRNTEILNRDGLRVVNNFSEVEDAFFFIDPPYPKTDQGHYRGYSMEDFNALLNALKGIKGKFLLTCYPKDGMDFDPSWHKKDIDRKVSKGVYSEGKSIKTESIITNYKS